MPEQNRPEHIGRIDHSVISLTISGIARAVNQGGRHQRDGQKNDQHHYQPPGPLGAAIVIGVVQIAQAVVIHIKLVDIGKEVEHPFSVLSRRHILIEGLVHIVGDLLVCHGIVRPHGQIAIGIFHIDDQDAVAAGQLDFLPQGIGVIANIAGHPVHHRQRDETVISLDPVGIIQADVPLLAIGEHAGLVPDIIRKLGGGQAGIQPHLSRLRDCGALLVQADDHRRPDHRGCAQPGYPGLLKKFHIGTPCHLCRGAFEIRPTETARSFGASALCSVRTS